MRLEIENAYLQKENASLLKTVLIFFFFAVVFGCMTFMLISPFFFDGTCRDYNYMEAQISLKIFNNTHLDADHDGTACE